MAPALVAPPRPDAALPRPPAVPPLRYALAVLLAVPLLLAGLAALVQYGPLDMALSRLFVDPATQRFEWRHAPLLELLGHQAARGLPIAVGIVAVLAGLAAVAVERLRPWRAILLTLGAAMIVTPLVVNQLKGRTTQPCPVEVIEFGGARSYGASRLGPFWAGTGASPGHCLPSGHAGGGYALLALFFAGWASGRPAWRHAGLAVGVAAGIGFSLVRMVQGAHFASATVWSVLIAWTICAALFMPLICRRPRGG